MRSYNLQTLGSEVSFKNIITAAIIVCLFLLSVKLILIQLWCESPGCELICCSIIYLYELCGFL
jgi:hypothetical protein